MRMYTKAFNKMSELNQWINSQGIAQDQIVSIFPSDGMFYLSWYGE